MEIQFLGNSFVNILMIAFDRYILWRGEIPKL